VTLFGIFLTPVFYYVIQWVNDSIIGDHGTPPAPPRGDHHANSQADRAEEPSGEHALAVPGEQAEPTYSPA
jgi:hypothetical protein